MAWRFLILVALCAVAAYGQQCDKEFEGFFDCLRDTFKKSGPPGGDDVKAKLDKCFTDAGCEALKPPGEGPPPGQDGQGGPPGSGGEENKRKCFQAIQTGLKGPLTTCVRKTDPSFNPPSKPPPEFDGPGEHGGPGGAGEQGPGGPGGFGPPPGGFGPPLQLVQAACSKAPSGAAEKVAQCIAAELKKHGPPSEDELRQEFNKRCGDKKVCEAKLSQACKDKMEKLFPAICQCHQDLKAQAQQIFQQEPACKGLQFPEKMGPFGKDCKTQKPDDPCQQGFDAIRKQSPQNGPRSGDQGGQGGRGGQDGQGRSDGRGGRGGPDNQGRGQ